jgi:hypothetical protein
VAGAKQIMLDDLAARRAEPLAIMRRPGPAQLDRPTEPPDWPAKGLIAGLAYIEARPGQHVDQIEAATAR